MNRRSSFVVAALTVSTAVALGIAPAATAAPSKGRAPHSHATHVSVTKDARLLAALKTQTGREITRKDTALARTSASKSLGLVAPADAATVRASIAADRSLLAGLRGAVAAAGTLTDARTVAARVAQVRPETYAVALGALMEIADAQSTVADDEAQVADLAAQADALEAQGADVTAVRTALDAVTSADADADAAATVAHDLALALTATSPVSARAAVGQQLEVVAAALATATEQLQVAQEALLALQAAPTA